MKPLWLAILAVQDELYPQWRTKKPRLLYTTALAGEAGEVCGVVTHLDGGGTNLKEYTEEMVLEEAADTFIQLVLVVERSGFTIEHFQAALKIKLEELHRRHKAGAGNRWK